MSWQAVQAVMERSRTRGTDRMVLMVIATHADKDTFSCFVGLDTLCQEANTKERALQYAIERLRATRELHVEVGHGRGHVNIYTLTLPATNVSEKTQPVAPIEEEKDAILGDKRRNPASEKTQPDVEKTQPVAPLPIEPTQPSEPEEKSASAVRVVFAYWQQVMNHPQAKLTDDRSRVIRARLREGYTVEQIKQGVDGCKASPFHMGENERADVHDDLTLICRSGSKLEKFIARPKEAQSHAANGRPQTGGSGDHGQAGERPATRDERRIRTLASQNPDELFPATAATESA